MWGLCDAEHGVSILKLTNGVFWIVRTGEGRYVGTMTMLKLSGSHFGTVETGDVGTVDI